VNGPSLHLSWPELACHDKMQTAYPLDWREVRAPVLARAFEDLRLECCLEAGADVPLIVLEGYRTQVYQDYLCSIPRYAAAKNSQHVQGRALDIACPVRWMPFPRFQLCMVRASARPGSPIRYIEYRPSMSYIHFDTRPTTTLMEETIP
jgi:hypothetical protein